MTFSIVIPIYNAEKYLKECLKSVDAMYIPKGVELEVLLIENGSTDGSAKLCDTYSENNSKYKSFHFWNIGAYNARREGMKKACGDYILFADADDQLAVNTIDCLVTFLKGLRDKTKWPDMIIHNAAYMDERDNMMFEFPFTPGKIYQEEEKKPFYEVMCEGDSLNALWNKCIKKSLAEKIIMTDDKAGRKNFNHGEDLLQTAELLDEAKSIVYLDNILYFYRDNSEGLTGSFHKEFLGNQVDAWRAFDQYADKWTDGSFEDIISERKTLTCTIAVKSLIYSRLSVKKKKSELLNIMSEPFYGKYATRSLPDWAPEEDEYVHELMLGDKAFGKLMMTGKKYNLKSRVKKALGKQ